MYVCVSDRQVGSQIEKINRYREKEKPRGITSECQYLFLGGTISAAF